MFIKFVLFPRLDNFTNERKKVRVKPKSQFSFRLHQICKIQKRENHIFYLIWRVVLEFLVQILTKAQDYRSLLDEILLGAPEKGKNPKSTEL